MGENAAAAAFKVDIRADSNRDGKVDVEGSTDSAGKDGGAIFLPNIGDTDGRCARKAELRDAGLPDEALAACHDASDDVQRAPHLMAPIRTLPIRGLGPSAVGTVSVSDDLARRLVRIFRPRGHGWEVVTNETAFSAEDVARGLRLGIDARTTRGHNGFSGTGNGTVLARDRPPWDGRATVHFTVRDGRESSTDSVVLRVAPVLSHHHLQAIETVVASGPVASAHETPEQTRERTDRLATLSGLDQSMRRAGIRNPLYVSRDLTDDWAQDVFEPGYASMPGPNGTVGLRILMVPRHGEDRPSVILRAFRAAGVGAVIDPGHPTRPQVPKGHNTNLEAGGNLETIPPYEHAGKEYPAGRIIMGGQRGDGDQLPYMLPYLQAQEAQDPLILDSLWVEVQHVDEFIQFLPADTPRGWRLMVADPDAAVQVLRDAQARGFGAIEFERRRKHKDDPSPLATVDDFLKSEPHLLANSESARFVRASVEVLMRETGLTADEIFGVPVLYRPRIPYAWELPGWKVPNGTETAERVAVAVQRREIDKKVRKTAIFPNAINGLVLSRSLYVSPKQYGPLINGTDIMEEKVRGVYRSLGYEVNFIDDFYFAKRAGDIHCATNTFRDASAPWWKYN
ncbi:hypothetical protein CDD83_6079 [Cordyceps sp. RAO-2017]|nr:hypothetical protein CDD83_6079 [Cordyceps sp. RAO-2017]